MTTLQFPRLFMSIFLAATLAACGGGGDGVASPSGDGASGGTPATPTAPTAPVLDSFGRTVPATDASGVGADADAAGADGTAGDGAPIVGGKVLITDMAGKTASATTDNAGYYRANVKGFTVPLVVQVTKADGTVRRAPSVAPLKKGGFTTINISGITDKIASDVAVAGGKTGASQLTPAIVQANAATIGTSLAGLRKQLYSVIVTAGLSPATYDPLTVPFMADHTGYDFVLDHTVVAVALNGPTTVAIIPGFQPSLAAYAGTYVGTYGGSDHGTFNVVIDSLGHMSGTITSMAGVVASGSGQLSSSGSSTAVFSNATGTDVTYTGSITPEGLFSGDWDNNHALGNGTFTGNRQ